MLGEDYVLYEYTNKVCVFRVFCWLKYFLACLVLFYSNKNP
mgnify:CR=1 FL=1